MIIVTARVEWDKRGRLYARAGGIELDDLRRDVCRSIRNELAPRLRLLVRVFEQKSDAVKVARAAGLVELATVVHPHLELPHPCGVFPDLVQKCFGVYRALRDIPIMISARRGRGKEEERWGGVSGVDANDGTAGRECGQQRGGKRQTYYVM